MMKHIKIKKLISTKLLMTLTGIALVALYSCDPSIGAYEFDLPEAGSQADATPPTALFSSSQGEGPGEEWKDYSFGNQSTSATTYAWDFGDGNTSTDVDGANTYSGEGTWTVSLTASDALGVTSMYSETITVVEPEEPEASIPEILEPGFDMGNDSRDVWRNSALGGVIQITGSGGYYEGNNGAKLPDPGSDRIGYQEISEFTPNQDYVLKFKYRFKDDTADFGVLNVLMLTATTDPNDIVANTVASVSYSEDVAGVSELLTGTLTFNSGANTSLAIFFYNELDEAYIDSFEIDSVD